MQIRFWGTRGSIASPGPDTLAFGGNTSCCEVQADGNTFIFDSGTGIRGLGNHLLRAHPRAFTANLFISHPHWDHIQGFPFFAPLFIQGFSLNVFGPQEQHQRLSDTLGGQMQYRYFPVDLDELIAAIRYQELREERLQLGRVSITTRYLNHTTLAMGYRLQLGQRAIVYATDTEPFAQQARAWKHPETRQFFHKSDEDLAQFCAGVDILILDAQYTVDEYPAKVGWGHGTHDYALDIAISAGVKTLVFFHHDPTRSDRQLKAILAHSRARAKAEGQAIEIIAASEGMTIDVTDRTGPLPASDRSPMPTFYKQVHVALVGTDETVEALARKALTLTHFKIRVFNQGCLGGRELRDFRPHLLLIEPARSGDTSRLREYLHGKNGHTRSLPVLALLPDTNSRAIQSTFDEGATDVLLKPLTASQLRSRVDLWLFRGGVAVDRRIHARKAQSSSRRIESGGFPAAARVAR